MRVCVCVFVCIILLIGLPGSLAAEDLESSSDPQPSPDDGCLDRHLRPITQYHILKICSCPSSSRVKAEDRHPACICTFTPANIFEGVFTPTVSCLVWTFGVVDQGRHQMTKVRSEYSCLLQCETIFCLVWFSPLYQ